jgi:hypothetical protein
MTEQESVLNRVINDVLTNPAFERDRLSYSKKGDRRYALANAKEFGHVWPARFRPVVPGRDCLFINIEDPRPNESSAPLLGIRLDKCDLRQQEVNPFDGNVIVTISNVGGFEGHPELCEGGTSIYYLTKREDQGWSVSWHFLQGQ